MKNLKSLAILSLAFAATACGPQKQKSDSLEKATYQEVKEAGEKYSACLDDKSYKYQIERHKRDDRAQQQAHTLARALAMPSRSATLKEAQSIGLTSQQTTKLFEDMIDKNSQTIQASIENSLPQLPDPRAQCQAEVGDKVIFLLNGYPEERMTYPLIMAMARVRAEEDAARKDKKNAPAP